MGRRASAHPPLIDSGPSGNESEVEAGGALVEPLGSDGVDVAFAQDDVVGAAHFDLVAVFGVEQHLVAGLHAPHVGTGRHDLGPGEPLADLGGGGDEDATAAPPLALGITELHEDAVVEHLDRKAVVVVELAVLGVHGPQRYRYGARMEPAIETVRIAVDDTVSLAVDRVTPPEPVGTMVVCHPHPLYGGTRHDMVVGAMIDGALAARWQAVRFDFRGAGGSSGRHDGGAGEQADLLAVLHSLDGPERVTIGGYSFGADVALSIADPLVEGWICVAPVLQVFESFAAASDARAKHLIAGAHDQFRSAIDLRGEVASWPSTTITEMPTADHFFAGSHNAITERVTEILTT